jgi:hypothetical protein
LLVPGYGGGGGASDGAVLFDNVYAGFIPNSTVLLAVSVPYALLLWTGIDEVE